MKIWVIGRSYPVTRNKMKGSFELEQAQMLAKNGNAVSYIACIFHPFNKIRKWGYVHWKENGVSIFAYSQLYWPNRLHIYWNGLLRNRWKQLLSAAEKVSGLPDVIHIHYPTLVTMPEILLEYQKRGVKIVTTEHWTAVQTGHINKHERIQLQTYAEKADAFLCVGQPLRNKIEELTGIRGKVAVVPNVVPDLFNEIPREKHKDFRFVAVGRLVPVKQFDLIVTAFAAAFKGEPGVSLTIVGGGSEYRRIRRLIRSKGVSDQVKLTGAKSRKQTAEIIANSDLLICFSRLETFGVPVIEAWYCGIPVIATDAIGFAEYWNDGLGCLLSGNDTKQLAETMRSMKADYAWYSHQEIQEFARAHFSEAAVYSRLQELYR